MRALGIAVNTSCVLCILGLLALALAQAPARAAATAVDPGVLKKCKAATVFIEIVFELEGKELPPASGSGFFITASGYCVTNWHVVSREFMVQALKDDLGLPRELAEAVRRKSITLVFNSGTPQVKRVAAEVVALDESDDLAVLKAAEAAPDFLGLGNSDKLLETQILWAFGFPAGDAVASSDRGPEISVTGGAVTSLRRDAEGELSLVQMDASVTHGSSGGPVTDEQGVVRGVTESGLPGTGMNFAVPSNKLRRLLDGCVANVELGTIAGGRIPVAAGVFALLERGKQPHRVWAEIRGPGIKGTQAVDLTDNGQGRWEGSCAVPPQGARKPVTAVTVQPLHGEVVEGTIEMKVLNIKVGPNRIVPVPVGALEAIRFGPGGQAIILTEREVARGTVMDQTIILTDLDGQRQSISIEKITMIVFTQPEGAANYIITIRATGSDDQELIPARATARLKAASASTAKGPPTGTKTRPKPPPTDRPAGPALPPPPPPPTGQGSDATTPGLPPGKFSFDFEDGTAPAGWTAGGIVEINCGPGHQKGLQAKAVGAKAKNSAQLICRLTETVRTGPATKLLLCFRFLDKSRPLSIALHTNCTKWDAQGRFEVTISFAPGTEASWKRPTIPLADFRSPDKQNRLPAGTTISQILLGGGAKGETGVKLVFDELALLDAE